MSVLENKDMLNQLDQVIAKYKGQKGAVMQSLQDAQEIFGHVPKDVQIHIAEGLGVTLSEVYGVATFYSQFALEPRGRFIVGVCMGTACYVRGAKNVLDKMVAATGTPVGKTSEDGRFTIRDTRCLGACGLAPVIMINDDVYGRLVPDDVPGIVDKYKEL
ncbi:NAD(P)H-dependent oxidoreductase subunit E [Eubacteriales bacterium OttesenSCG-928-N13]|nr:NAD(P)H-dependent oxidoreductase subunit E [Eubacteriales bacterium OttesenSCG-928-N13]